jgi:hypothetical protein
MIGRKKTYFCWTVLFFGIFLVMAFSERASADYQTNLQPGVAIKDKYGVDLDVGSWSIPVVYDWNNDGKKDLIVGATNNGQSPVAYYENKGTNASPAFDGYEWIQACNNTCTLLLTEPEG